MTMHYKGHAFDGPMCSCCDKRRVLMDPTQTGRLRSTFRQVMAIRWRKLREQVRSAIMTQDLLHMKQGFLQIPSASVMMGAQKLVSFQRWFEYAATVEVLGGDGSVVRPYISQGYDQGALYAQTVLNKSLLSSVASHRTDTLVQLGITELQGIVNAVSQQATRAVAHGLTTNESARDIVRAIWSIIEKIGVNRTNQMIELLVVKAHSEASLDIYAAALIKRVGLVPEGKPTVRVGDDIFDAAGERVRKQRNRTPSRSTIARIRRQELALEARLGEQVNVRTAGDDYVCPICEDISEEGPYDIDEARSLIPAHPNCRCVFVPANDARFAQDYNSNHEPAGSPEGGEFASGGGGGDTGFTLNSHAPHVAEITNEALARKHLPKGAETTEGAENLFNQNLAKLDPTFYHEAPGHQAESFRLHGVKSSYGAFAAVNKPSGFVTSKEKTVVQFKLPKSVLKKGDVSPDMIYGYHENLSSHQIYLLSHPKMSGGFVSYNGTVPTSMITKIDQEG